MPGLKPLIWGILLSLCSIDGQLLIYKYESTYKNIWSDQSSGVSSDVSIWKAYDQRFFPLGDIVNNNYNYPTKKVMMVLDKKDGLVAPPASFSLAWTDKGSGASKDVTIYRMNPKDGYRCIGYASVGDYKTLPNLQDYRCLKSNLLTRGVTNNLVWSINKGTPMSLWNVNPNPLQPQGIDTGLFIIGSDNNNRSPEIPYVVYGSMATTSEAVVGADHSIALYQVSDVKQVWNDKGSRAKMDTSIWRAKECCNLGDRATSDYNQVPAFVAKEIKPNSLAKPTDFLYIWSNRGGRGGHVAFWKPICPNGYAAVGHIANPKPSDTNTNKPSVEDIRCVNSTLLTTGKWTKVWEDKGAGAKEDCTVYRADPITPDAGVSVSAMGAVKRYGPMDDDALVFKQASVKLNWGKRASSISITNVVYDFAKKKVTSKTPMPLTSRTSTNNCASTTGPDLRTQTTLTTTIENESTWSVSVTIEIGLSFSFTAGIPDVASSTVTASASIATTAGTETRKMESREYSVTASVTVPAGSIVSYYMSGNNYKADIPWTGDLVTTYADGTTTTEKTSGIYKGSQISDMNVVREKPTPCGAESRKLPDLQ